MQKSGAFSTFKISGYPANFLNASQTLFAVDSTAGATWMGANAPLSDISEGAKPILKLLFVRSHKSMLKTLK